MRSQLEAMELAINESRQQIGKVTASFGIAELGPGEDPDELAERADEQLYQANSTRLSAQVGTEVAAGQAAT